VRVACICICPPCLTLPACSSVQSYILMTDLVDHMFPPIAQKQAPEFTDSTYWAPPLPTVTLPDLAPPSPALSASARSDASAFSRLRNFSLRSGGGRAELGEEDTRGRGEARVRASSGFVADAFASLSRSISPGASVSPTRVGGSDADGESDEEDGGAGVGERKNGRRRRRRRSIESMPGSMPGTDDEAGEDGDGEEEDEELFGMDGVGEGGDEDDEEAEEPTFDDDLFATGEMQKVPFL
jgi:phosphatidate phosphatase LPIN